MNSNIVEQILQLRRSGMGMGAISKELNISYIKVRYHCRKHNLSGVVANNFDTSFETFLVNIKNNHGNEVEYVSGYIDSEKPVLVRCLKCGDKFSRAAQFARKKSKVKCLNCEDTKRIENDQRNKEIKKLRRIILTEAVKVTSTLKELKFNRCVECDKQFYSERKVKYCSNRCSKRKENRRKELKKRKARLNGHVDYSITIEKLIQKEKNVCYLCGGQCNVSDFYIDDRGSFIVGHNYPSIEHIVPICKGGTHSWDNVKLAHHYCNSIKRDKKIIEDTGQMVLML